MNKIIKFFPYICFYLSAGFIFCIAYSFLSPIQHQLLPQFTVSWKFSTAGLLFIFYFPFLYVSALFLGYTIIFRKYGPVSMKRRSIKIVNFLQSFFIILISALSIYVVLAEAVKPIILDKRFHQLSQTETYFEYVKLAKAAYTRNDYEQAIEHINRASAIWEKGKEAAELKDVIKIAYEKENLKKNHNIDEYENSKIQELIDKTFSPAEALKIAEKASMNLDFYTAHYYAKLAFNTLHENDELRSIAEDVAEKSWKNIQKGLSEKLEKPGATLFAQKKAAYEELQNGNYINAYYSFLRIQNEIKYMDEEKKDVEVERFLHLAEMELKKNIFFRDELHNIPGFSINKNINFHINPKAAIHTEIKIYGISHVYGKATHEIFLMNTEYKTINLDGSTENAFIIPYAKLIKNEDLENPDSILMQVRCVDRNKFGNDIHPTIIAGNINEKDLYNIILNISLSDFYLIEKASRGSSEMNLSDLYNFIKIAEKYGFNKADYMRELFFRLSEPILLLISSIIAIIAAWLFRIQENTSIKKRNFIIAVPLCSFLAYILVQTIRYLSKLEIAFFVSLVPTYSHIIIFTLMIFSFIIAIICLFFQRSE